ncbi:MAG: HNH endonuclease [Oscillospiraceae bacterium]|nr:HNH endonuclease [Oscillospiraceae bacterium]
MFKSLYEFYRSKEWVNLVRQLKLERVNSAGEIICGDCKKPIVLMRDCIGHHTIPLELSNLNDYSISLNPDCIELLHFKCHNIVHNRFGLYSPQKVYLVYGAPCSGKITWVLQNKFPNDIILDIDFLYKAVTGSNLYYKPDQIKSNIFTLRDCLLDQIKTRYGKWQNAYIIGTYPILAERERITQSVGAEQIFIDEDKATCLKRLYADSERTEFVSLWENYISDWFDQYQPNLT